MRRQISLSQISLSVPRTPAGATPADRKARRSVGDRTSMPDERSMPLLARVLIIGGISILGWSVIVGLIVALLV